MRYLQMAYLDVHLVDHVHKDQLDSEKSTQQLQASDILKLLEDFFPFDPLHGHPSLANELKDLYHHFAPLRQGTKVEEEVESSDVEMSDVEEEETEEENELISGCAR